MSSRRRMHSCSPSRQVQVRRGEKHETVLEGNINTPGLGRGQAPTGPRPKHPGCHSNLFAWILIVCQILYWEYFNHSGSTNSLLRKKKRKSWQQIIHGSNYLSVLVCFESECRSSIAALCSQCHTERARRRVGAAVFGRTGRANNTAAVSGLRRRHVSALPHQLTSHSRPGRYQGTAARGLLPNDSWVELSSEGPEASNHVCFGTCFRAT